MPARRNIAKRACHPKASATRRSRRQGRQWEVLFGPLLDVFLVCATDSAPGLAAPQPAEKPVVGRRRTLNPFARLMDWWRKPRNSDPFAGVPFDELFVVEYRTDEEELMPSDRWAMSFDNRYEFFNQTRMVIELLGSLIILRARLLWSFPLLRVPELVLIVPPPAAVPLLGHGDPACPHIPRPPPAR
jgi:hypothetical protein